MSMHTCIKCGFHMCDATLYYRLDGESLHGIRTKIKCPNCGKVQTIQEMINKEIMKTSDKDLTPKGLGLKEKLKNKKYSSFPT